MGRRVDPGPWGGRALTGPRERLGSRPEEGGGRGGRQSPRPEPAYLGSPGLGTDAAPISAQVRAGGTRALRGAGDPRDQLRGPGRPPALVTLWVPGESGGHPPRPQRRGSCDLVSVGSSRGPAGSETHRIPAPTTAPDAR